MQSDYLRLLKTPLYILYEITYLCNNRCLFCYNEDYNNNYKNYACMSSEKFTNLLNRKPFMIVFTGGEPLLSKNLFNYASLCKSHNVKTSMITNGTMIDTDNATMIKELFDNVQVSMQGHNKKLHDSITQNKGSFDQALNGIRLLINLKVDLNVNLTLTNMNKDYIPQIVRTLSEIGVENFSITRFCNSRSANSKKLELKKNEFLSSVKLIESECIKNGVTFCGIYSGVPLCLFREKVNYSIRGCSCGHSWITITPDGGIKPCPGYDRVMGDIECLEETWNGMFFEKWRNLEYLPASCLECEMVELCKGGCRTAAYNCFGDVSSLDPLLMD